MITKKHDQPHHDLVRQYPPDLILNTVLDIIRELGDPYDDRLGLGGMTAYPSMVMATVCIRLAAERTPPQDGGHSQEHHTTAAKIELAKISSKNTIAHSYWLIPEWHLVQMHQTVIREVEAGSLASGSTGFSYRRLVRWFDVRACMLG